MFIDMLSLPNFDEFDLTSLYTGISCSLNTIVSPSASEFISDFRCMCKPFFLFLLSCIILVYGMSVALPFA